MTFTVRQQIHAINKCSPSCCSGIWVYAESINKKLKVHIAMLPVGFYVIGVMNDQVLLLETNVVSVLV